MLGGWSRCAGLPPDGALGNLQCQGVRSPGGWAGLAEKQAEEGAEEGAGEGAGEALGKGKDNWGRALREGTESGRASARTSHGTGTGSKETGFRQGGMT